MGLFSRSNSHFLAIILAAPLWFSATGVANAASAPTCQSVASDPDGDGWGWENNRSCVVTFYSNVNGWPGCTTGFSDTDGDGYGWENFRSCVVTVLTPQPKIHQHPSCENSLSDPDGDGWGWENRQSCIVTDRTVSSVEETVVPKVGEATDGEVTDTKTPVCLSTASDPNGTGYGYEFNQGCRVVAGVSKTANDPLYNTEFCENWAELAYGNYRIQNNTWNRDEVYSDQWSQCIELQQNAAGDPVPTWRFDWLARSEGNQDDVKSYPQVYYGRKNERNFSGSPEQTGLPRLIDELDRFRIDYSFSARGDAEYNVALESFFHTSCEAADDNKQFEMMVWVGVPGEKTPGTQVTTAEIDGMTWKVYANPVLNHGYVAFVAEQTIISGQLDWNAFIDWSRQYSPGLGLGTLENSCMGAIEMGTESFWGELEFRLNRFDISRY